MASHPIAAVSRPGRGRGGGIRLTSYSPKFDFSYLATQTISHSTAAYKSFFNQRKKSIRSRQNVNKSILRSLQYKTPVQMKTSSQSLPLICEESVTNSTMPSLTSPPSPALASQKTPQAEWSPVTNGAKVSN